MQVQFIPTYAGWVNLIELWWKQPRFPALKGRRFETLEELVQALVAALEYWKAYKYAYCWKEHPQEQGLHILGGFGFQIILATSRTWRKELIGYPCTDQQIGAREER